jgi:hypothetical protein
MLRTDLLAAAGPAVIAPIAATDRSAKANMLMRRIIASLHSVRPP